MKKRLNNKKKIILVFAPILAILVVVGLIFGIKFNNKERETISNNNQQDVNYSYAKVYLADSENVLYPLTVKYETPDTQAEELMYLFSLLKKDSIASSKEFNGLLPKDLTIKGMTLKNDILNINFDDSIKTYNGKDELRIMESLVWTFTDLPYVLEVSFSLNDELLTHMPVNNTPLSYPLSKQMGINNYLLTSSIMGTGEMVLSYYEKVVNGNYYYVPVTHYVSNKNNLSIYDLTIQTLFKDPGITSSLSVCRCIEDTKMVTTSFMQNNILYLSLSEDILFDELTVSFDVYQLMKEVTCLLEDVQDVSFLMDLEEVMVNGSSNEDGITVSKVELNKYYI